jgi:hypothetical protein
MRGVCFSAAAAVVGWVTLTPLAAGFASAAQEPIAVDVLVNRAAAYVRQYQEELTSVVADETYTQHVKAQVPRDGLRPLRTSLTSEIFFMFTAGDWMAIRDVRAVDGKPLADRPDLREALRSLSTYEVAGKFKTYNSRFNVGRVTRNFNEPTLSLLPLDDRHRARFTFERARARQADAKQLVTLAFKERTGPTLIRNLDGGSVFSSGEITIEPDSGRVSKAILAVTIDSVTATLSTTYAYDKRLGMSVPMRFGEHYVDGVEPRGRARSRRTRYEDIVCEARYSNFQRFEVVSRIR